MLDLNNYIDGGKIKRDRIALDIRDGRIVESDIDALVSNNVIRASFIGNRFDNKRPVSEWNAQYLNELTYGVIAEGFNEEYLLYLGKVSTYVRKQSGSKTNVKMIIGAVAAVVAVAVIAIIVFNSTGRR